MSVADTIAAIATGTGVSAIGIIRISGDDALGVAARVFRPAGKRALHDTPDRRLVLGDLLDQDGRVIDSCLCTVSRAPNTYTGEDTAELQCHGSPLVLAEGLLAAFAAGARQAGPGEFTKRAFLSGRMDLTQAEAVADLIDAETAEAAVNAAGQLSGAVSRRTDAVYETLAGVCAHFHALIDYPDDEIEEFDTGACLRTLRESEKTLSGLLDTFSRGRFLKDGVPTAIIGRPNVGKSSLLNALLGYERAIVTDVPGTTRDTVEERCRLGGVSLRLIDTAGLRKTADAVEQIGIERTRAAIASAELVLAVTEAGNPLTPEDEDVLRAAEASGKTWIAVRSKLDLAEKKTPLDGNRRPAAEVFLSARTGEGLDTLARVVEDMFAGAPAPAGEILTNARQADAVSRALRSVREAADAAEAGFTPDAVLSDAEEAMRALGELTGRSVRDDVVQTIFSRFCVGK